jgi:hypothetical protein
MASPTTADEWIALAAKTRAAADSMSTKDARETMLKLADHYDLIAKYMRETVDQF